MNGQFIQQTAEPGVFTVYDQASGQVVLKRQVDYTYAIVYDAEDIGPGITAGQQVFFFRNIPAGKTKLQTNLSTPGRLESRWEFLARRCGVYVTPRAIVSGGDTFTDDARRIINYGYSELKLGGSTVVYDGPNFFWPAGYGESGFFTANNMGAAFEEGGINNGVPAPGAVPYWDLPVLISNDLGFEGLMVFFNATTLTAATRIYMFMVGQKTRPVR